MNCITLFKGKRVGIIGNLLKHLYSLFVQQACIENQS